MRPRYAVLLAALIVGAALLWVTRWQYIGANGRTRVNRWTGRTQVLVTQSGWRDAGSDALLDSLARESWKH